MEFITPLIAISALFSAFVAVRLLKGAWMRNPQYLALSIVGSLAALLLLHAGWPQFDTDFVMPTIVSFIGSCAAVYIFDQLIGAE